MSTLETLLGTAHSQIQLIAPYLEVFSPKSDLTDLMALRAAHLAHDSKIPETEITDAGWKLGRDEVCNDWWKGLFLDLRVIKAHGVRELAKHSNDPEAAKHQAMNTIAGMMVRQMKICGDVTDSAISDLNGSPHTPELVELIYIYVLYTIKWTAQKDVEVWPDRENEINGIVSMIESSLTSWKNEYLNKRSTNENEKEDDHVATQEKYFNEYKRRIHQITDMFASTMITVCMNQLSG